MSKQREIGSRIRCGKIKINKKLNKDTSSEEGKERGEMAQQKKHELLFLAVVTLVVAISVAPLTAEIHSAHSHNKSTSLKMDEAFLTVNNELGTEVVVSWMSDHCYQCLYQQLGPVPAGPGPGMPRSIGFVVGTQHGITLQLNSSPLHLQLCTVSFHFGEHGNYSLWVKNLDDSAVVSCSLVTEVDPVNSYIPILIAFLVFTGLTIVYAIGGTLIGLGVVRRIVLRMGSSMATERLINNELGSPERIVEAVTDDIIPPMPTSRKRLRSLDTFRGISLVVMVFVNYGGGRYWFFKHESWNGLTVADLVFPWFVFIMGTSIALSVSSMLHSGTSRCSLFWKAVWRSLQLFLIGVLVINPNYCQGPLSWENLRIPGVLQRLAWSYLVVACLDLLVARARYDNLPTDAWWYPVSEMLLYWPAWLIMLLLEIFWLFLTFLLPVPGCLTGYLGPGGIGDMGLYPKCTGGAAGHIDRWLLGDSHIYQTPSSQVIYMTCMPYDPEGVLGSINSILMAFLGLQAGKIFLHYRDLHSKIMSRFLIWGLVLGVLSAILTNCSRDQGFIPVNKNLWSLSYVTTLACFAFVVLVLVYYTVDVKKWWTGAPFYYPVSLFDNITGVVEIKVHIKHTSLFAQGLVVSSMNSILVYVGHEVFEAYFPFRWRMANSQSHAEHLTQNLLATSCWVLISYILYKKKIFWKI